jgi:hypothetical protein
MIRQAFDTLDKALEARLAAKGSETPVDFKPPTETQFAAGVAKDMAKGVMQTQEARLMVMIVGVVAVVALVSLLLSRCGG